MNKLIVTEGTILAVERLKNSRYGCPSWLVVFKDENNKIIIAKTAQDSISAYAIGTYSVNRKYKINYHIIEKNQHAYIDYVIDIEYEKSFKEKKNESEN